MGNEGIFKGVAGEWRYGQGGRCLKKFDDPWVTSSSFNIASNILQFTMLCGILANFTIILCTRNWICFLDTSFICSFIPVDVHKQLSLYFMFHSVWWQVFLFMMYVFSWWTSTFTLSSWFLFHWNPSLFSWTFLMIYCNAALKYNRDKHSFNVE